MTNMQTCSCLLVANKGGIHEGDAAVDKDDAGLPKSREACERGVGNDQLLPLQRERGARQVEVHHIVHTCDYVCFPV